MKVEKIEDHKLQLKYDGALPLSYGKSRKDTHWKNLTIPWSALLNKLETPSITPETHDEFMAMSKAEQDRIKDNGGFVGGSLRQGRRKADMVECRQLVTLDADYAKPGFTDDLDITIGGAYALYCTHKHTPQNPRLRLLIPLDRQVDPEEYEAIARKLADRIGIEYFDDTTYQANRMMFWPSIPRDVEYVFDYNDEEWLTADDILDEYPDWKDISYWPTSSRTKEQRKKTAAKLQDPRTKTGLIGAFCRTYSIKEAIDTFLADEYEPCAKPDRYTYRAGSTAQGLHLHDDVFAYSEHATDPASHIECNAFDLIRIHKFGNLDEDAEPGTRAGRMPSFKAMEEFVLNDRATKLTLMRERKAQAKDAFGEEEPETDEEDDSWTLELSRNKKGEILSNLQNCTIILAKDPELKGIVFNRMADSMEIKGGVPWKKGNSFWRDTDDSQLEIYLANNYAEFPKSKILSAVDKIADDRAYHPVREYLEALPEWDGVPKVDSLLTDYLGAEDNDYTKAVIRKTLCAAYMRVYHPGIKFDAMPILNGGQGIGKSTFIERLGLGKWYSDSLSISDMHDKTAAEKLQGYWILEVGELAGMRKADVDKVKAFISRQDDKYRASYGRRVEAHPRQCVIFGTTNSEDGFLRDITGNRRYWIVKVTGKGEYDPWDLDAETVNQIWAEVKELAPKEKLFLPLELEKIARKEQAEAMEQDPREGLVREYLDMLLPLNWAEMDPDDRKGYFRDYMDGNTDILAEGRIKRTEVSGMEIWMECFGKRKEDQPKQEGYAISAIMARLTDWERAPHQKRQKWYGPQRVFQRKKV